MLSGLLLLACLSIPAQKPPNLLWISSEDNGPHLGCYGDPDADTPELDALAAKGMLYRKVWSNAPICAPARTTLISGVYATSSGAHPMRSRVRAPAEFRFFPQLLREAGYYCSNRSKEDYSLHKPGRVWDDSSGKAHWRNRPAGAPFFAVFNFTLTHESQIRRRPHEFQHQPEEVHLPAYYPDLPEVRQDWAQYHDQITAMDRKVGQVLRQLEEDRLSDSTIIFYFADHGAGLPRNKRWAGNSGLHVPLIVSFPPAYRHLAPKEYQPGGQSDRLVAFIDFAPTVLSLAGLRSPSYYQGVAFAGPQTGSPRDTLHGFTGRIDERLEMVRSVRDSRYVYLRNYFPHRPHGQHVAYMFQTPTTRAWRKWFQDGGQGGYPFWTAKVAEELYDLQSDPFEIHNLADSPQHQDILLRLRQANRKHILETRDLGFLPEPERFRRAGDRSLYALAQDRKAFPLDRLLKVAEEASLPHPKAETETGLDLSRQLQDSDPAIRYWAAMACLIQGPSWWRDAGPALKALGPDPIPEVAIAAYQALLAGGESLPPEWWQRWIEFADPDRHSLWVNLHAWNGLDAVAKVPAEVRPKLQALKDHPEELPSVFKNYLPRLREHFFTDSESESESESD
ncbi:MAG: sulfatase [Planctomycetota bacterium]|nr:MAG: sulfatase [Planctomycetota bacterium]